MPTQRGYRQACGVARGLDIVGERWSLLVVRELLLGPKRFTDLQQALPTASPNALSDRLRELADAGVVRRRQLPPPGNVRVYELTAWGRGLEPIVVALGTWALAAPPTAEQVFVSADSAMLSIRTFFVPTRSGPRRRSGSNYATTVLPACSASASRRPAPRSPTSRPKSRTPSWSPRRMPSSPPSAATTWPGS